MATAFQSAQQLRNRLRSLVVQFRTVSISVRCAYLDERKEARLGTMWSTIRPQIAARLTALHTRWAQIDAVSTELDEYWYPIRIFCRANSGYTYGAVDVDDGGGHSKITADGGEPFANLAIGDTVAVSDAADPDNDGDFEVQFQNATVAQFTDTMSGGDTAKDKTIVVTLTARA